MDEKWWRDLTAEVKKLPGVSSRLLDAHVEDGHGRCQGCQSHSVSRPWPCTLRIVASGAPRISASGARR